jgi:hypothetical protein
MRRIACFAIVALLAACGGGKDSPADDGVVDRTRPIPSDVRAFVKRVADPAAIAFTADYALLNKNGGGQHTVHVESRPKLAVTIDGTAVDLEDEPKLASYGIFSGFLAKNPKAAIEAAARRVDASDAIFSTRTVAGVRLDCIVVPVQGAQTSTACLTPDGIFGFVDNPSVRYELTAYTGS